MTVKETIQMLERMLDPDPWEDYGLSDKAKEALQMAIDALEKQIPRKPIKNTGMVNPIWSADSNLCPACFKYVNVWGNKFCSYCSQAIDWTEDE